MKNQKNIKISIITVCLNAVNTVENSIKSVISQNYSNIEYIFIDGKSNDGSIDIINKYKNYFSIFVCEKDNGIYDAMNKGLSLATGDFIYFLGADDLLMDNIIERIIPYLKQNLYFIHYGKVLLSPSDHFYGGNFNKWRLIHKNIAHQSIFYPAFVFYDKKYNEKYQIEADWDFNLYLMSKKIKFKYNGLIIASFNTQGISKRGDFIFQKYRRKIIKEYFGIIELAYLIIGIQIPISILNFVIKKYNKFKIFIRFSLFSSIF